MPRLLYRIYGTKEGKKIKSTEKVRRKDVGASVRTKKITTTGGTALGSSGSGKSQGLSGQNHT